MWVHGGPTSRFHLSCWSGTLSQTPRIIFYQGNFVKTTMTFIPIPCWRKDKRFTKMALLIISSERLRLTVKLSQNKLTWIFHNAINFYLGLGFCASVLLICCRTHPYWENIAMDCKDCPLARVENIKLFQTQLYFFHGLYKLVEIG